MKLSSCFILNGFCDISIIFKLSGLKYYLAVSKISGGVVLLISARARKDLHIYPESDTSTYHRSITEMSGSCPCYFWLIQLSDIQLYSRKKHSVVFTYWPVEEKSLRNKVY